MALEAIAAVEQAEAAAAKCRADALQTAKQLAAQAEADGIAAAKAAAEKAREELRRLSDEAEAKARLETENIRKATAEQVGALRAQAQERLSQAADHIVERIVNG